MCLSLQSEGDGKTGPMAAYAVHSATHAPKAFMRRGASHTAESSLLLSMRNHAAQYDEAAVDEWEERKDGDLKDYWPRSRSVPLVHDLAMRQWWNSGHGHGHTHWWTMFNPRQLLVHGDCY